MIIAGASEAYWVSCLIAVARDEDLDASAAKPRYTRFRVAYVEPQSRTSMVDLLFYARAGYADGDK